MAADWPADLATREREVTGEVADTFNQHNLARRMLLAEQVGRLRGAIGLAIISLKLAAEYPSRAAELAGDIACELQDALDAEEGRP